MMAEYEVVSPIQHDGEIFVPGDTVSEGDFGDKKVFQALVDAGAVQPAEEEDPPRRGVAAQGQEPPPNYQEPDLRLGSGDPSRVGGAVLDLQTSEPTNIPTATFTVIDQKTPPPIGTTPQAEVAKKLAAQVEQPEQLTLEDAEKARDEEQAQVAEQAASQLQGGLQEAEEPAPKPAKKVAPVKEQPSPAQAQGSPEANKEGKPAK
jgi:hypothetical protein